MSTNITTELLTELDQIRRIVGEPMEHGDIVGAVRKAVTDANRWRLVRSLLTEWSEDHVDRRGRRAKGIDLPDQLLRLVRELDLSI